MTDRADTSDDVLDGGQQFVTFEVGTRLYGLEIANVQEILRYSQPTAVPHVPVFVSGVINLRGEVVTVVDLKFVLQGHRGESPGGTHFVIAGLDGDRLAFAVDEIRDVVAIDPASIEKPSIRAHDERSHAGVARVGSRLLIILDTAEIFAVLEESRTLGARGPDS